RRGTGDADRWATQRTDKPNGNHAPARCSASSKRRTPEQRESIALFTGPTSERASPPFGIWRLARRRRAATGKRIELRQKRRRIVNPAASNRRTTSGRR